MNNNDRINVYKQIAALLVNKQFHYQEMELLANAVNYLAQEIKANEQTESAEAANDNGPESEATVHGA